MSRRTLAALTAATLVGLLITGTFAWTNFNQSVVNSWKGKGYNPGGTLHDDFLDPNKDVYIENWGTSPILIRIRLDEYMETGSGAGLKAIEKDAWGRPVPNPDNHATPLNQGSSIDDVDTWEPHIPADKPEIAASAANYSRWWTWVMGGQKYYYPADPASREQHGYVAQNNTNEAIGPDSVKDGIAAKQTRAATALTMYEWQSLGSPLGDYWVINADGWAYWADSLLPGEATGLLLNSVSLATQPSDDYYYAINVIAQMATVDGVKADGSDDSYKSFFTEPGFDEGRELMDKIAEKIIAEEQSKAGGGTSSNG
jgi:hypothetical protein